MPKVLLSFELHGDLSKVHREWVQRWTSLLRQRGLRCMVAVSAEVLLSLERARAFDLLDVLSWHECGLRLEPGPLPARERIGQQTWWQERLSKSTELLADQLERVRRFTGQMPHALVVDPAHYSPQVGVAAARLGIEILAHAPFEDKARGRVLELVGCGYLRRHLEMDKILVDKVQVKTWKRQAGELADSLGEDGWLVVGTDLADPGLIRAVEKHPKEAFEAIAAFLYEFTGGKPAAYAELPRSSPLGHLEALEVKTLSREVAGRLKPLQLGNRWLSLSELFSVFVQAGTQMATGGKLSCRVYPLALKGPLAPPPELSEILVLREELWAACVRLMPQLQATGHIPSVVHVSGQPAPPSSFLFSVAQALHHAEGRQVKIPPGPLPQFYATDKQIRLAADDLAALSAEGRRVRNAILCQCWTAKPR